MINLNLDEVLSVKEKVVGWERKYYADTIGGLVYLGSCLSAAIYLSQEQLDTLIGLSKSEAVKKLKEMISRYQQ